MATGTVLSLLDKMFTTITLTSSDDLNDVRRNIIRFYYLSDGTNRPTNCPSDANYAHMITINTYQIVFAITNTTPSIFIRRYVNGSWAKWCQFDGTKLNV